MAASILDGKTTAEKVITTVRKQTDQLEANGLARPGLAVVLVGDDPASRVYVGNKHKACDRAGIRSFSYVLPEDVSEQALLDLVAELNERDEVHGILVQAPLPEHISENRITEAIKAEKDVDGFHPYNVGRLVLRNPSLSPCTPRGIMRLLYEHGLDVRGRHAVVVGASNIVGRPMTLELLMAGATTTCCHRFTANLPELVAQAEILVVAVGKQGIVSGEWIRKDAIVIDVGINRMEDGSLQGDLDFVSASQKAGFITPVPGGVGPMTVATLMVNTLQASGVKLWQVDHRGRFTA